MTITEGIAERTGRISYADLPQEAVHWATAAGGEPPGAEARITSDEGRTDANRAGRALPAAPVERLRQTLSRCDEAGSLRDAVAAVALFINR